MQNNQVETEKKKQDEIIYMLLKLLETFGKSTSPKATIIFSILEFVLKIIYKIIKQNQEDSEENEFYKTYLSKLKEITDSIDDDDIHNKLLEAIKRVENRIYFDDMVWNKQLHTREYHLEDQLTDPLTEPETDGSSCIRAERKGGKE